MTGWRAAFALQADACRALGSPLTAAICDALAEIIGDDAGPVAQAVRGWPGDTSYRGDSVPLRLCGALHGLVLDGAAPDLAAAYGGRAALAPAIAAALDANQARIMDWLRHPPQTNEVGRSAALIAAAWFLARQAPGVRFDLLELGASAGLNLNFPCYRLCLPDGEAASLVPEGGNVVLAPEWRGAAPMPATLPVGAAQGVDLNPLDPRGDRLRLLAYIWPDQPERIARMRAALDLAARRPPQVAQGDAGDWLDAALRQPAAQGRLVYHTIAAQYFPQTTRHRIDTALTRAGALATPAAPLAHLELESAADAGAVLALRLWDGASSRAWRLARASAHVTWIDWNPQELPTWNHR